MWLPLNVVIVDNNRGDSPSSYRARALIGLVLRRCPEIPHEHFTCKVAAVAWDVLLSQSARGGA
jgi:Mg2+/Co2+ transporter CorB